MKTTVPLKGDYMGFHVSLGERKVKGLGLGFKVSGFRIQEDSGLKAQSLGFREPSLTPSGPRDFWNLGFAV